MRRNNREMLKLAVAIVLCSVQVGLSVVPTETVKIVSHALTPQGIKDTGLSTAAQAQIQKSAGLLTTGIGMPVYLEVEVTNKAMTVTQVVWTLQSVPALSTATLTNSILTNLTKNPIYNVGDRSNCFVPTNRIGAYLIGRQFLRPDVVGQYRVSVQVDGRNNVVTSNDVPPGGTTTTVVPVSASATNTVTAATYLGVDSACGYCHDGHGVTTNDNVAGWYVTAHADAFERKVDGGPAFNGVLTGVRVYNNGPGFGLGCYACHTTGYDSNSMAINGGFDDVMASTGWMQTNTVDIFAWTNSPGGDTTNVVAFTNFTSYGKFTYTNILGGAITNLMGFTNLTRYATNGNWASMPVALQDKANIQCEDCHGPASQHNGDTNKIAISVSAGMCGQCHDALNAHWIGTEWGRSAHGSGKKSFDRTGWCVRCHSAKGFIDVYDGDGKTTRASGFEGITCATCHDPHPTGSETNEFMLRTMADVVIGPSNGAPIVAVITAGGKGKLCMQCHRSRFVDAVANTTNLPAAFGPHDSPVADMLAAVNGIEYGGFTNLHWRTPHLDLIEDSCVHCHMQYIKIDSNPTYSNNFMYAGGHTMKMTTTNGIPITSACAPCHVYSGVLITNFDFSGVQTHVEDLLAELGTYLPTTTNVSRGTVSFSANAMYNTNMLMALYNYKMVEQDRSMGVHNAGYATALLEASIADMQKGWSTAYNNTNQPAGWRISAWFGDFYLPGNGWIWHAQHGWMYASMTAQNSIWLWTSDMGWLWTSQNVYPFMYRYSPGTWMWYVRGSASPRWFYSYLAGAWETH